MVHLDKYPFLLFLLACISGIILYQFYPQIQLSISIATVTIILLSSILFYKNIFQQFITYFSILSFIGISYCISYFSDITQQKTWYGNHLEKASLLFGTIQTSAKETAKTYQYELKIDSVLSNKTIKKVKGKILLYIYKTEEAHTLNNGDVIAIPNKVIPIQNFGNPYSFNYKAFLARSGIYHQCFLAFKESKIIKTNNHNQNIIQQLKSTLSKSLDKNVSDNDTKQLMKASLLNERIHLSDEIWETYSKTGIVHIIAISGMHITLLFTIILFLLKIIRHKKHQWIAYLIALPLVWIYIIITNSPASAVRAGIMFSITALSIFIQKPQQSLNTLFVTATIMLLIHPNWLYDLGMQLSFICILSIILFYEPLNNLFSNQNRIVKILGSSIAMSIAVQILTAPIALIYFNQFPLFTFIANIPAAFYSTFLLICGLLIFLFDSLSISASIIGFCASIVTKYFNMFIEFLSVLTPLSFQTIAIDTLEMLLLVLINVAAVTFIIKRNYYFFKILSIAICLFIFNNILKIQFNSNQSNLIVYNINQKSYQVLITNLKHQIIVSDSINAKEYKWNVMPSLIHANAIKESSISKSSLLNVNNKNIFVLGKEQLIFNSKIPKKLDALIISCSYFKSIENIIQYIPAKIYVLDSSFKRWQYLKLEAILSEHKQVFHNVQTMGAWQSNN